MKKTHTFIVFVLILFLFFSSANAVELNTYGIKLTKDAEFSLEKNFLWDAFTAPILSLSDTDQIIIASDAGAKKAKEKNTEFVINYYKLKAYGLNANLPKLIWTGPKLNDLENAVVCGDLFNDNTKALYIFYKDKIEQYKNNGKKFIKQSFKLPVPYYVKQAKIGDIDNDGKNELVAFVSNKDGRFALSEKLSLIIYKTNEKNEFSVVYFGTFSYSGSGNSDELVCIDDIYGTGQNKLVIKLGKTNIEPSEYKVLSFQNNKLYKEKIIDQTNNISLLDMETTSYNPEWQNKIINKFSVIKLNGKNYLLSAMLPQTSTPSSTLAVSSLTEKKLVIYAEIRLSNADGSSIMLPLNLKGKGANSNLLYLTENGKAAIYSIGALEE